MNYCKILIGALRPNEVALATCSETRQATEFRLRFPPDSYQPPLIDLGALPKSTGARYQLWLARVVKRLMRTADHPRVVVLESDKLLPWLAFSPGRGLQRLTLLVMRSPLASKDRHQFSLKQMLKEASMAACSARGAEVLVLAPAMPRRETYSFQNRRAVPDPIRFEATPKSIADYKVAAQISDDRKWAGVFGNITRRKNVGLILDALMDAGATNFGLLLAGQLGDDEKARLGPFLDRFEHAGGLVRFDNRVMGDVELDSAIASVDVAVIAHSSEGPSGILGKAVAAGSHVIVAGAGSLREDVDRLGTGTWTPLRAEQLAVAFAEFAHTDPRQTELAGESEFARVLLDKR